MVLEIALYYELPEQSKIRGESFNKKGKEISIKRDKTGITLS